MHDKECISQCVDDTEGMKESMDGKDCIGQCMDNEEYIGQSMDDKIICTMIQMH